MPNYFMMYLSTFIVLVAHQTITLKLCLAEVLIQF